MRPTPVSMHIWLLVLWTFIFALMLNTVALPTLLAMLRPDWVALTLIFWCVYHLAIGVKTAFVVGLLMDALQHTLLGQHALPYILIATVISLNQRRIRSLGILYQALVIMGLLLLEQLILTVWINGWIGYTITDMRYLLPVVMGTLLWPWFSNILMEICLYFNIK